MMTMMNNKQGRCRWPYTVSLSVTILATVGWIGVLLLVAK